MRNDKSGGNEPGGQWPQVQWPSFAEHSSDAAGGEPTSPGATPAAPTYDDGASQAVAASAPVEPDGYVYDDNGYAHPVYGGYVYDEDGNAYAVEGLIHPAEDVLPEHAYAGYVEHAAPAPGEEHLEVPQDALYASAQAGAPDPTHRLAEHEFASELTAVPGQWDFPGGTTAPSGGKTSRARRASARRGGRRRRSVVAVLVSVALVVAAGWGVYNYLLPLVTGGTAKTTALEDFPGPGSGTVQVSVKAGDSGAAIARELKDKGVVASTKAFTAAFTANPAAGGIQPGTYNLFQEMKASDAVAALLDKVNRVEFKVTIPEGYRLTKIYERISSVTQIPVDDLKKAAKDSKSLGLPKDANGKLEGWLYPATYSFEPNVDATKVLSKMVAQTIAELDKLKVKAGDREAVLIKASLVEAEAKRDEDRGKMARAIENRLERDITLGIDATLAYGLDKSGLDLTKSDLASDNPYNTRKLPGLPPTPIGAPGLKSVQAVIDPPPGEWLFWVTVNFDTGETKFANDLDAHNVNKAEMEAWLADHPQK